MIQLDIRSRTKDPTPTPSVVRNPTPPKNLRLRNPGNHFKPLITSEMNRVVLTFSIVCFQLIDVCGGRCLWKEHSSMVLFSESYIYSLSRQRDNFKCKLSFSYPDVNLQYLYRKQVSIY